MSTAQNKIAVFAGGALWLACVACGAQIWMAYDHTPGPALSSPLKWPVESSLMLNEKQGTLIVFIHPLCGCTRAGLAKLQSALHAMSPRPTCYAVVSAGCSCGDLDQDSQTRRIPEMISGSCIRVDAEGTEAARFGATTSGFVLYYDGEGRLRFAGGVTTERGGRQECSYERALLAAMTAPQYPIVSTPVFGCLLVRPPSR